MVRCTASWEITLIAGTNLLCLLDVQRETLNMGPLGIFLLTTLYVMLKMHMAVMWTYIIL